MKQNPNIQISVWDSAVSFLFAHAEPEWQRLPQTTFAFLHLHLSESHWPLQEHVVYPCPHNRFLSYCLRPCRSCLWVSQRTSKTSSSVTSVSMSMFWPTLNLCSSLQIEELFIPQLNQSIARIAPHITFVRLILRFWSLQHFNDFLLFSSVIKMELAFFPFFFHPSLE